MPDVTQRFSGPNPNDRIRRRARLDRDTALERLGSITKKVAVGSVAAATAIGFYLSQALPGHSTRPATPVPTGSSTAASGGSSDSPSGGSAGSSASASGSSGNLAQPANPPSQTQQQAPVVSGST